MAVGVVVVARLAVLMPAKATVGGSRAAPPPKGYTCFHCNSAKHRIGDCPVKLAGKPPCNGAKHCTPRQE